MFKLPARFFQRSSVVVTLSAGLLLAGCQTPETPRGPQVMTGAAGTKLEAERVVKLVYGQQPDSAFATLPYAGGDITPAIKRMRARLPQLKPLLESGVLGLSAQGSVVAREPSSLHTGQHALVNDENLDRTILYRANMFDTGHLDDPNVDWIRFTTAAYAVQWASQAPAGWWVENERGEWLRKPG
jgi:hypothetical protein